MWRVPRWSRTWRRRHRMHQAVTVASNETSSGGAGHLGGSCRECWEALPSRVTLKQQVIRLCGQKAILVDMTSQTFTFAAGQAWRRSLQSRLRRTQTAGGVNKSCNKLCSAAGPLQPMFQSLLTGKENSRFGLTRGTGCVAAGRWAEFS